MYKYKPNEVEGKDFINCNCSSSTELGKLLYNTHDFTFNTILGKCLRIKNFLEYCSHESMPLSFLLSKKSNVDKNKYKPKTPVNYWGLCVYVIYEKLKQCDRMRELLKENTLPLTVYYTKTTNGILGKKNIVMYCYSLSKYVEILERFSTILKENKFNDETVNALIKEYSVTEDLFEGSAVTLN